jgi:hypothetical protein
MVKLITIQFYESRYGSSVKSTDADYLGSSNGYRGVSKLRLARSLKNRMKRFYPGVTFIFNIS